MAEISVAREGGTRPLNAVSARTRRSVLPFDAASTSTDNLHFYRQLAIREFNESAARNGWSDEFYNTTKARVDAIDRELRKRGG